MKLTMNTRQFAFGSLLALTCIGAESSFGYGLNSISYMAVANRDYGGYLGPISSSFANDTTPISASVNTSFTGLDGMGNTQTMTMVGSNRAQSNYGVLKLYADLSVGNTYYNRTNLPYYDSNTNTFNTSGSPDSLTSLGFAIFDDALHFSGNIQAGDKARYIFHAVGTNTGYGAAADLGVTIDGGNEGFFDFDPGHLDTNWITQDYAINTANPQLLHVQFSNQVVVNTYELADGSSVHGTSDFYSTLTLAGIQVVDANGNNVQGWNVTSDSGTAYTMVPEPGSVFVLSCGAIGLLIRRRRR